MTHRGAALDHYLLEVTQAERKGQIPVQAGWLHFRWRVQAFEGLRLALECVDKVLGRGRDRARREHASLGVLCASAPDRYQSTSTDVVCRNRPQRRT